MDKAPAIFVKGKALTKDGKPLFEGLSLSIESNAVTCLLGESGVGKSTLLRLIAGLSTHTLFEGVIYASDEKSIHNRLAYMAQSDLLFPWLTVAQNVALGIRLRGEKGDCNQVLAMIEKVGLQDHITKKPNQLSGGQRQRVALARTLMEDKEIILLDEPFSALDAKTRSEMQDLTANLLKNRTVLLITHDPGEAARLAHKIYIMSQKGLEMKAVPNSPIPRDVDDLTTLELQGQLLRQLRGVGQ